LQAQKLFIEEEKEARDLDRYQNYCAAGRNCPLYLVHTVNATDSEECKMQDKKDFFSGIVSKLSILMGGAVLVTGAQASMTPTSTKPVESTGITMQDSANRRPLPPKLTLKQQSAGFKLIAAHGSHSSHASHASHSSHSSHSSRAA